MLLADMQSHKERAREIIADSLIRGGAISIDGKKMILVNAQGIINVWDLPQVGGWCVRVSIGMRGAVGK